MLKVSQHYHYTKDNKNQRGTNDGTLTPLICTIFFTAASITSEVH